MQSDNLLDKVLKYATLIYAALILIGYWNVHVYYTSFGVDIWAFLTTGELLLSFLRMVFDIMIFAVCMTVVIVEVRVLQVRWHLLNIDPDKHDNVSGLIRSAVVGLVATIAVALISLVLFSLFGYNQFIRVVWLLVPIITGASLARWYAQFEMRDKVLWLLVVCFLIALTIVTFDSRARASAVRVQKSETHVRMKVNDHIIESDSTHRFVGRINAAVFFFNASDSTTTAYNTSDISEYTVYSLAD